MSSRSVSLRPLLAATTTALLCFALPAAASAAAPRTAQPLVDLSPLSTSFHDTVLDTKPSAAARAAASSGFTAAYKTTDGTEISVTLAAAYKADPAIGQSYVDFLGSLPHGSELGRLKVVIDTPANVVTLCGGVEGTLACYNSGTHVMTVPGEQIADAGDGVTTSFVVAHEYGHHIAAYRSNPPFRTIAVGPKRWASAELVCRRTNLGQLFPGDEDKNYTSNPGEAWAETYAHLTYPDVAWSFTPLLTPDTVSLAAARADVLTPWTSYRKKTFSGTGTTSISFPLTLDGAFKAKVTKGSASLKISSEGRTQGTSSKGSLSFALACRSSAAPTTKVTATGPGSKKYTVDVVYAG